MSLHEMVTTWKGQNIEDLPRDEMLEALKWMSQQYFKLQEEQRALMPHVNHLSYLTGGKL